MSQELDPEIDRLLRVIANCRRSYEIPDDTEHRDGVDWMSAPLPRRLHKCFVQTSGFVGLFDHVQRCACGAIRNAGMSRRWLDKNSRRKTDRRGWRG